MTRCVVLTQTADAYGDSLVNNELCFLTFLIHLFVIRSIGH